MSFELCRTELVEPSKVRGTSSVSPEDGERVSARDLRTSWGGGLLLRPLLPEVGRVLRSYALRLRNLRAAATPSRPRPSIVIVAGSGISETCVVTNARLASVCRIVFGP